MDAKELGRRYVHPVSPDDARDIAGDIYGQTGVTLRQHFAGLAMQGFCSNQEWMSNAHKASGKSADECVALAALEMADALLAQLSKDSP